MGFTGFGEKTFTFLQGLARNNSTEYFHANREVYDRAVRGPLQALAAEVEPEFGEFKVGRPHRDTRFTADKSPYKTEMGMVSRGRRPVGYYLLVSPEGLTTGAGYHAMSREHVDRYRHGVDDEHHGPRLDAIVTELTTAGYDIVGDRLKTHPRGYRGDHPRLHLLRHRSLGAERRRTPSEELYSAEAAELIRADWRELAPLQSWLQDTLPATR